MVARDEGSRARRETGGGDVAERAPPRRVVLRVEGSHILYRKLSSGKGLTISSSITNWKKWCLKAVALPPFPEGAAKP